MAARKVIINEPLCFIRNRLGKLPEKLLKDVLVDFFDAGILEIAKTRLVEDIDSLQLDSRPYTAKHQAGPNQAKMEADDLFRLFVFVDDKLQLDSLPLYVAENIDRIPTIKWLDGELQILLTKLSNLESEKHQLKADLFCAA